MLINLQAASKKIKVVTSVQKNMVASVDPHLLNAVLRNLLSNAIKFTPQDGSISVGALQRDSNIEIFVHDSGRGICKIEMEKINKNDYYTTNGTAHEPGSGLGLMICKEFLVKHGTSLQIESEPGNGSKFFFRVAS